MADSPHEGRGDERKISRRDFLDGVAISAAGLAAAAASPSLTGAEAALLRSRAGCRADYYPPTATGHHGPAGRRHPRRDGASTASRTRATRTRRPPARASTRGTCATSTTATTSSSSAPGPAASPPPSGTRTASAPDAKILLVDPLPDFGGHSHRNEFHIRDATNGGADVMLLRNGGTVNLDSIGTLEQAGRRPARHPGLLRAAGARHARLLRRRPRTASRENSRASASRPRYGLRQMLLFPKRGLGQGHARAGKAGRHPERGPEFLATTPYSPAAQAGIARIKTTRTTDWISLKDGPKTDQEKKAILARITYKQLPAWTTSGVNEEATS